MKMFTQRQVLLGCLLLTGAVASAQEEYLYDRNGNLVKDLNKGIDTIHYNHLNLMERVVLTDKSTITYTYDASGTKLSKTVTPVGGIPTTTHYLGGVEYEAQQGVTTLQLLATDEGRVTKGEDGAYTYEYNLKDHLGNVRVSFSEDKEHSGGVKLLQAQSYYAFGAQQPGSRFASGDKPNHYLYNSKEWQDDFGLDFYDYHARPYDPHVARWWNQDQLAEKYYAISPYAYVANNPTRFIDPDGREIWIANGDTKVQYKEGKLFTEENKVYKGKDVYINKVKDQLNELAKVISSNDMLKTRFNDLETGKTNHTIKQKAEFWHGSGNDPLSKEDREKGKPTGSIITYNPHEERSDGVPNIVELGHELLSHAWGDSKGKTRLGTTENGINLREVDAVNIENTIRAILKLSKKTTYGKHEVTMEPLEIPKEMLWDTHNPKKS